MFEDRFRLLIFTIARSEFAVSAALKLPRTAIEEVLRTYSVDDRAQIEKPLKVAIRSSVVHLIKSMNIKEMIYDHS